jgi:3'-phosphoadenosine 5'-phosphosulfate sulfotransferase (PAPS reductase)/FAD synthetase
MRPPPSEPILTDDDRAVWDAWAKAAREHARTQAHRRLVARSRAAVLEALALPDAVNPGVSWSAGKDSTAMAHLVCVTAGAADAVTLVSEKDDLDYPGEREYVETLAAQWGARLKILTPPISPREFITEAAKRGELMSYDDIHSRAASLSKACFYGLMEADNNGRGLVMLGLRAEESQIRKRVGKWAHIAAAKHRDEDDGPTSGLTRWHKGASQWRCYPVMDWKAVDVFGYLLSHGVEPLSVYKCLGLMHRDEPGLLRKSWWLPGGHTADGQVAWLRRYYPSLHRQLCAWMPDARMYG